MSIEKPRWTGAFHYAYGHPDSPQPKRKGIFGAFTNKRVAITDDALMYQEGRGRGKNMWQEVFSIPRDSIKGVRREQESVSLSNPDQFVIVTMERDSKEYEVWFKAQGVTQQKDSFLFVNAVQELLSRQ